MKRIHDQVLKEKHLSDFKLQDKLPKEVLQALQLKSYAKGEYIFLQDDDLEEFSLLVEGKLQIDMIHPNGKQSIISYVEPLSVLGDLELYEDFPRVKNVVAVENCLLLSAPTSLVREAGQYHPPFLRFLINHIVMKLDVSTTKLSQTDLPFEARLAGYLLLLSRDIGSTFMLENREEIAGILGVSIRHLNRTLKDFEGQGLIALERKRLTLLNQERLEEISRAS